VTYKTANNNPKGLTLFVFANDASVMSWQFEMIERMINALAINTIYWHETGNRPIIKPSFLLSLLFHLDGLLANCTLKTLKKRPLDELPIKIKKLNKNNIMSKMCNIDKNMSVVINVTENTLDNAILENTPLPVFSVFIGKQPRVVSSLTGLLEFINGDRLITSGIQIERASADRDKNIIIFSSTTSIEPPSLCRTLETCLQKTSVFMARSLSRYLSSQQNDASVLGVKDNQTTDVVIEKLTVSQFLSLSTRFASRVLKRAYDKISVDEQWIILLGENAKPAEPNQQLASFTKIIPPQDEFWADPFMIEHHDKHYLFMEVFPFARDLGHLSCMEIKADGSYTTPVKILEKPYHLSYPNVFEYENRYYMIPETGDNQTVELYEASAFPYAWSFKQYLLENIRAYDSSLVFHDGLWWLFASVAETDACPTTEELYVFYADSPLSTNWTAHPQNPVVSDAASARPAGKLFFQGDRLIRPSQDCAGSYGAGINFCEVQVLNQHEYKETILNTLTADWDNTLSGVHTFNFDSKYTVSDAILINKSKGATS
jgi:hypothetical protein